MKVNHKLELMEQFDDAAFALMMDEYAEAEGERLRAEFEEAMRSGTTPECPPELNEKCRKQIKHHFGRQRRSAYAGMARRAAGRAVACLLIALGISAALVMSVEALRVPFWKFIEGETGDQLVIEYEGQFSNENGEKDIDYFFLSIPEGYRHDYYGVSNGRITARYVNHNGAWITAAMLFNNVSGVVESDLDSEIIMIGGHEARYTETEEFVQINWEMPEIETDVLLVASDINKGVFLEFCASVAEQLEHVRLEKETMIPNALEDCLPEEYQMISCSYDTGLLYCSYKSESNCISFDMVPLSANCVIPMDNSSVKECMVGDYESILLADGDYLRMNIFDYERELSFWVSTEGISEQDHHALCEYLAEYYKGVTLPAVSTVLWE